MNPIQNSFEIEDVEQKEKAINQATRELNMRLIDMGELSALDPKEISVIDSIREKVGPRSYDNLDQEIPEELLKDYVETMYKLEHERLLNNISNLGDGKTELPFIDKYEQAKALGIEVDVNENIRYVLDLNE